MPPVTKVEDQNNLVPTKSYPFGHWKFENFNPVQSRMMDFYDKETSGLIAATTSSGKTVVAEIFLAQEIHQRGGKGMYLVPMRALAQEKIDEWTDEKHHFGKLKISICTGDYRLTKERAKELEEADLIIMTSEMLNHRSRNFKAEQNNFLKNVGTIIVDESHLLTVPGRGDHLEVGLMKFTQINPTARVIMLSATMPNVEEIADWVAYSLTKRDTFVLRSKFRPVPLTIHYEPYSDDLKRYDLIEEEKVNKGLDIIEWYKDDKFLVFAHTKRTGEIMKRSLKSAGIEAEFHNADLGKQERISLEQRFKNEKTPRVVVATSTLAWGCNLPARRVVILGVHRGLQEVESYDILQMIGRSGRLGIDPMGDAYILVPESKEREYRAKYSKAGKIESQLLEKEGPKYKTLAFHLVSEIHHGNIETTDDVHEWYKRSLGYFQNKSLDQKVVDDTLDVLKKCGAIAFEEDKWIIRPIGKVSSMFYFSPFDTSDLYFNFKNLFTDKKENDDLSIAMALGNIDSQRTSIVTKFEKEEIKAFQSQINITGRTYMEGAMKAGFCYFNLLNGVGSQACSMFQRSLQYDFLRISQILQALDSFGGRGEKNSFYKNLEGRIVSGVPAHLVELCRVPNIGKVRANRLFAKGIKTIDDLAGMSLENFKSVANIKGEMAEQILKDARKISFN